MSINSSTNTAQNQSSHQQAWNQRNGTGLGLHPAGRPPRPAFVQQPPAQLVFTDSETHKKPLAFEYVATAVSFIVDNMRNPEAMKQVYNNYAKEWFDTHPAKGTRISYAECNMYQDQLLEILRKRLPVTKVTALMQHQGDKYHA